MSAKCYLLCGILFLSLDLGVSVSSFLECENDSDCVASSAYCNNSLCECPAGQVFSTDGKECKDLSVGFGKTCSDDNQCSWLLGKYVCSNNECICDDGWWYYNGRCHEAVGLGGSCENTVNCYNGYDILAMTCNNGTCECSDGYYLRGNYDCRPLAEEEGDYCSLDSDCASLGENYVCKVSACVLSNTTSSTSTTSSKSSLLSSSGTSSSKVSEEVLPTVSVLSVSATAITTLSCESNDDCTNNITNSVCYPLTKFCACKRGYFYDNNTSSCLPELGVYFNCTSDDDCLISSSRCLNGACYCRKTYFTLPGNFACQKPMSNDNFWCSSTARCFVLGTAVTCTNNECSCSSSAELDEDFICRVSENSTTSCPSSDCESNADCTTITNSICNNGDCVCPDDYRLEDSTTCLPNLGATCDEESALCTINHASCTNNYLCQCDENYTAASTNNTCYLVAESLGSNCEVDEQCSNTIENSICQNKECSCDSGYTASNGSCYLIKVMGDSCTSAKECTITLGENVYCRNGFCQCSADMVISDDGLDCISGSEKINFSNAVVVFTTFLYFSIF